MLSGRMRNILNSPELILFAVLLVAFFPIVLGLGMLKWDALDIYLPWKFFITESLRAGELPLWNPYISGGFAQMGDPGTWYPISWAIGLLGTYDVTSLHCEFLLHLYIAGLGFYYLCRHLNPDKYFSLMLASAYMLSGFMIGNAQHLGWLVSAAWLPFVFWHALMLIEKPGLKPALLLGFFSYLMFTGGYPPLFLSLGYVLVFWFAVAILRSLIQKNVALSGKIGAYTGLALLSFVLFSLPALVGAWDMARHITRLDPGFSIPNWFLEGAPGLNSLTTLLYPFTGSLLSTELWEADFSMVNWYIGLLPLLLSFYYWGTRNKYAWVYLGLAILFMLMSLGNVLPFRTWLAQALPMMDGFRFPGVFRLFFIFFALLSVARRSEIFQPYPRAHSFWLRSLFGLSLICLVLAVMSWLINRDDFIGLFPWQNFLDKAGFWQRLGLQAGLSCLLLLAGVLILSRDKILKPKVLCALGIVDITLAALLNLQATVIQPQSPSETNLALHRISAQKTTFSADSSYNALTPPGGIPMLWRNLSIYYKVPSMEGYNPYELKEQRNNFFNKYLKNSAFISTWIPGHFKIDSLKHHLDSLKTPNAEIQEFSNNKMRIRVPGNKHRVLTINMNYHSGWHAWSGTQELPIDSGAIRKLHVPAKEGIQEITLIFQPKFIYPAFFISIISIIGLIIFLILSRGEESRSYRDPTS